MKYFIIATYPYEGDSLSTFDTLKDAEQDYQNDLESVQKGYLSDVILIQGIILMEGHNKPILQSFQKIQREGTLCNDALGRHYGVKRKKGLPHEPDY